MAGYEVDPNSPLPRYYQVYNSLSERIHSGEFEAGEALPSERQLVIDYGVSRITVVKALDMLEADDLIDRQQGRGNFVRDCDAAESCMMECQVAFCVPTPSESYIFSILRGATQEAMRSHSHLQILEMGDGEEEQQSIEDLLDRGFDGLLLFSRSAHLNSDFYEELQKRQVPFVMVDRYCADVPTDAALFNDEQAAYALTEALIHKGHRRVGMVLGTEVFATSVKERLRGYRRALEDNDLVYDERLIGRNLFELLGLSEDAVDQLHDCYADFVERFHQSGPTAVVAVNNYIAEQMNADLAKIQIRLMQAVIDADATDIDYELKISLALVSHRPLSFDLTPVVAIAIQEGEALGAKAMAFLHDRISHTVSGPPRMTRVPMEIQVPSVALARKEVAYQTQPMN